MSDYIYTIVKKEKLQDMMSSFSECFNLPIQLIDEKGEIIEHYGQVTAFCNRFKRHLSPDDSCANLHIKAAHRAVTLGETYIFSCHSNMNHIVFPLLNNSSFFGSILVGPFLMEEPDSLLISNIHKRYPSMSTEFLLDLYEEMNSIEIIPPARVTQISKLLFYLFSDLISESKKELIINQQKLHQQSKINESIQMYKAGGVIKQDQYPYEKEKKLIAKVKAGNLQEARSILNQVLGYVFFSGGNSVENIKPRAIELCSLLSRAAIEGGAATDVILKINNQFIKSLQEITSIDSLCYSLSESLEIFIESMFNYAPSQNETIKKAISYISTNYSETLTLDDVSNQVELSPAYFSTLFKQCCGSSFKDYLNMVRIEESKRLLSNTSYSILDIAIAVGFENQSYFSKVFKKHTGLSPKQYRS
ncbi:MAG TPA: PocR ligand-binding domain-containing protein [Candidatus Pelethocola excrementipullorum]|nr:PocR ligand-binding domain-containing protein [Candidatus Pelethocola excrementipullorum]